MAPTQSVFQPVDAILQAMLSNLQSNGSQLTDFTTGSNARTWFEAFAAVVSQNTAVQDQLNQDSYLDTATGDALDALGANNWLVPRLAAVQATGQITITRQDTSASLTIPAGWGQLLAQPSVVGQQGVAVLTTEDADFSIGTATAVVTAQAVLGGSAGNLASSTFLTPLAPINTVSNTNGYEVTTAFSNGVDAESDPAYRARIPITVQGRVLGRAVSFQAAALSVPGVLSANVLGAGATRGDSTTVPAGSVETYYQGSAGLLNAVESAVSNAATYNQNPSAYAAVNLTGNRGPQRLVATLTVYCQPGTNTSALQSAVSVALQAYVNGSATNPPTGVGGTVYYSLAIEAVLAVPGVVSIGLPFTQFSKYGGSGAADITVAGDAYGTLAAADTTVTVTTI